MNTLTINLTLICNLFDCQEAIQTTLLSILKIILGIIFLPLEAMLAKKQNSINHLKLFYHKRYVIKNLKESAGVLLDKVNSKCHLRIVC